MPTTWCVLLWMAVDGGLGESATKDIEEARKALDGVKGTELAMSACVNAKGSSTISDLRTSHDARLPGVTTMERYLDIEQFIWNRSDQRVLVLWGHGDEPIPDERAARAAEKVPEGRAIAAMFAAHPEWRLPTVIGYDACTMALADVLRDIARVRDTHPTDPMPVVIASQIDEPASGWPYNAVLGSLLDDLDSDARSFASKVVDAYADLIKLTKKSYAIGAFEPSSIGGVQASVSSFVDQQVSQTPRPRAQPIFDAIELAQGLGVTNGTFDLKRLTQILNSGPVADAVATALGAMTVTLQTDLHHQNFGGLSVVLPRATVPRAADMVATQFAQESQWSRFWKECIAGP